MSNMFKNLFSSPSSSYKSSRRKSEVVEVIKIKNSPLAITVDDYSSSSSAAAVATAAGSKPSKSDSKSRRHSMPETALRATGISLLAPIQEVIIIHLKCIHLFDSNKQITTRTIIKR